MHTFPDPVCAQAIKSLPFVMIGIPYFCTGVGTLLEQYWNGFVIVLEQFWNEKGTMSLCFTLILKHDWLPSTDTY